LFNNKWNTNFRSFWAGDFSGRIRLWPISRFNAARDLVTPSEETLAPMLTGLCNYKAGTLPPAAQGMSVSRPGTAVTAFGPNPDGTGTLLRVWELTGNGGECTIHLPSAFQGSTLQPITLRGSPAGASIPLVEGRFTFQLPAFAPASFRID
jgi:hypothetical protein